MQKPARGGLGNDGQSMFVVRRVAAGIDDLAGTVDVAGGIKCAVDGHGAIHRDRANQRDLTNNNPHLIRRDFEHRITDLDGRGTGR